MEYNEKVNNVEIEINVMQLLHVLWSRGVLIFLAGTITAMITFMVNIMLFKPIYTSSTNLYIISRQNTGTTTLSDVQTSTQLVKDFQILVTSRSVTEQAISELGLNMSAKYLAKNIEITAPTDTRILEISVTDYDPYTAKDLADKIAEVAASYSGDIMQIEQVSIIDRAEVPTSASGPHTIKNVIIGFLLGIIICGAIVIIRFMMDDTVNTSEDIQKYFGLSTLALIPLSNQLDDSKYNSKNRYKSNLKSGRNKKRK